MKGDLHASVSQIITRGAANQQRILGEARRVSKGITIPLPPEMIVEIERVAAEIGAPKATSARWLLSLGLEQFSRGRRPEYRNETSPVVPPAR